MLEKESTQSLGISPIDVTLNFDEMSLQPDNTDVTFKIGDFDEIYFQHVNDPVNNPAHYNHKGVEAIAAIEASMTDEEFQGYLKGNCMKYLWRYKYKGKPVEDLKKAQWYLDKLIASVDNV
jgi:hypothetical protein